MRDPEHDRLGLWAVEISDTDPLPSFFQPYRTRDKIPSYVA